jgi:hypothetical protein
MVILLLTGQRLSDAAIVEKLIQLVAVLILPGETKSVCDPQHR